MEPLRPLSPGSLTEPQTTAVVDVATQLLGQLDDKPSIMASLPGWIDRLGTVFEGADGFKALHYETRRWVCWTRVPGYWLGYLLQEYAKRRYPPGRPAASLLYAWAQECVGDVDGAESTAELLYHDALLNHEVNVIAIAVSQLRSYHEYYTQWSQPGTLSGANPLLQHPYHYRTWRSLRTAFSTLPRWPGQATVEQLQDVVEACQDVGMHYYLPIARRWVAIALSDAHRAAEAAEQLRLGIEEAYLRPVELPAPVGHDAEIGHLRRLRGETLGYLHHLAEAEEEHELGLAHENAVYCSYWQMLSAKELGHVRLERWMLGGMEDDEQFAHALEAYRVGRRALDLYLMITESPIARAAALQLVSSMSETMIALSIDHGRFAEAAAELESLGPHGAADALAELLGASQSGHPSGMQKVRAAFHRHLTTVPEDFGEYLAAIPAERELRRAYVATRTQPDIAAFVVKMCESSLATDSLLKMRVPDSSVALFHVGMQGQILVIDLADDPAPTYIRFGMSEERLHALHAQFRADLANATDAPERAVDALLESAHDMLGEPLASLAERVRNRHVKLFGPAQLSVLPLHAIEVGDGRLIDHCDVSYGQSLGLLTSRPADAAVADSGGLTVLLNASDTTYLAGSVASFAAGKGATVLRDPTLEQALAAAQDPQVGHLVFACHGKYSPEDPAASHLCVGGRLSLARLFESGVLPNCLSVTMAACSSGLGRAEIASESVGLPSVFLGAGARTVLASLWDVYELPTALLLDLHFGYLGEGLSPARSLNAGQRALAEMPLADVLSWVRGNLPEHAESLAHSPLLASDPPFAAPMHWSAFTATGDF